MSIGEVQKGNHCVWQIHCHLIFLVKCYWTLLDKIMTKIVEEIVYDIKKMVSDRDGSFGNG